MRLVHRRNGDHTTLAKTVETADSLISKARGLMFRRRVPDDYALVFRFNDADRHSLHMLFVPFDIDALWLIGGEVKKKKRLSAWTGIGFGMADTIIELPAGAAEDIEPGDLVELDE
ncbi:DUF192 domain-containing protein [Haloferax sp. DFSO60]|uniref:DUF192 domain-containing protein n=1 Tax=Haloferax sp. DFSO60 TaxID=3388652 RepID=UPI0039799FAC